jgi:hypothetical protein
MRELFAMNLCCLQVAVTDLKTVDLYVGPVVAVTAPPLNHNRERTVVDLVATGHRGHLVVLALTAAGGSESITRR